MPRKMAKAPYLGRLKLQWCTHGNLPVLDSPTCPKCKNPTIKFNVTPPGDIRPAFEHDLARIRTTIDSTFGEGWGVYYFQMIISTYSIELLESIHQKKLLLMVISMADLSIISLKNDSNFILVK